VTTQRAARALIFTADDFGLHERVNAAVERAHRDGVLNAASLMVGAPAAQDAIARARRLPSLAVGLHLVLADGPATLPAREIPALVGADGRFGDAMAKDGCRFFFLPHVRAQLRREIRAQFDAFAATGLPLDHVNAHKHFHLHPTVLSMIVEIGRDYGLRAVRLPYETTAPVWLRPWCARGSTARGSRITTMWSASRRRAGWTRPCCSMRSRRCRPVSARSTVIRPKRATGRSRRRWPTTVPPTNSTRCCRRALPRR
jgi:hopanoid biosynthesis associated protein HpnK